MPESTEKFVDFELKNETAEITRRKYMSSGYLPGRVAILDCPSTVRVDVDVIRDNIDFVSRLLPDEVCKDSSD